MPIRVKCDSCKKTLSVRDHLAGKKIKCPVCQSVVVVPATATVDAPPKAEPTPSGKPPLGKPVATKPVKTKPPPGQIKTNGTPSNGAAEKNGEPEIVERPPESIEAEALSAFADEPKEEADEGPPQFIDFTCTYCDEALHLPIDQAGKQIPCPNAECKRIIKVPVPQVKEKKDWRKMDRRGPAAAIVNQPEAIENAWGTEEATKARQDSLKQAGVIETPVKPGIGITGWLTRAFYALCILGVLAGATVFASKFLANRESHNAIKDIEAMLDPRSPKIIDPLQAAEAKLAVGLQQLQGGRPNDAKTSFQAARAYAKSRLEKQNADDPCLNEQLFLIDLAIAQIELGGSDDEFRSKVKLEWSQVPKELSDTLSLLKEAKNKEAPLMAMREVATRLIERNQLVMAHGLASALDDPMAKNKSLIFAQQLALMQLKGDKNPIAVPPDLEKTKEIKDAYLRVGFAEGAARQGKFEDARKWVQVKGPRRDRLQACIGVAAIALGDRKNKDEASKFIKDAIAIAKDNDVSPVTPWQRLELIRLAARTEEDAVVKELAEGLGNSPFRTCARLEVLKAQCEKAAGSLTADAFADIETEKEGSEQLLAQAWLIVARHNARNGAERKANRTIFEQYLKGSPPAFAERLRPMVDIGTYQGALK